MNHFDGTDPDIYYSNFAGIIPLTINDYSDGAPQISEWWVVWEGQDGIGFDTEIFVWDGSAVTQLTLNDFADTQPQISGSNVVWEGYDGSDSYEFFLHGSTTTPHPNNDAADRGPATVSGTVDC